MFILRKALKFMNKKILLIQFRDDITTEHEARCYQEKLNGNEGRLKIINAILDDFEDNPKDLLKDVAVVIIGGSAQYNLSVGEKPLEKGLKKTEKLFKYLLDTDFPTFGVCFGHVFIAQKLGGTVVSDKNLAETGTGAVVVNKKGKNDKFLSKFPGKFLVQFGHKDSVAKAAPGQTLLASSKNCENQILKYKNNIFTVQFHPELNVADVIYRVKLYPEYLKKMSIEELTKNMVDSPHASKLMREFVNHYVGAETK